jgi:peptide/nickel transport system permease protein
MEAPFPSPAWAGSEMEAPFSFPSPTREGIQGRGKSRFENGKIVSARFWLRPGAAHCKKGLPGERFPKLYCSCGIKIRFTENYIYLVGFASGFNRDLINMGRYLAKRLIMMIPVLFGITLISFAVMKAAPGDPVSLMTEMNPQMNEETKKRLRAHYGLDDPFHIQYGKWLRNIVMLDFGVSFASDARPVLDKIAERIPITLLINVLSMIFILAVAIPLGVLSAVYQDSLFDKGAAVFVFLGFAVPGFWLALLLMILFGVNLGWLPISGYRSLNYENLSFFGQILDVGKHLILPVFVSAFGGLAGMSRYMRSNMLEVIRQDYITTARAKGLDERTVIFRHALRNALLPVITLLGLSVPGLIGGSVIFETVFAIPGMGQLFYQSVMMRDYPTVMGILVIGAVLTLAGNLIADLSYSIADPRIRVND